jgi:type I restriction enzyme S subunit
MKDGAHQDSATRIPPGYKQTEVGVIPEDWEVRALGQLISSVEYGSSAKSSVKGDIPVLRMGNLQGGEIDWTDLVYTNDDDEIRRYALNPGDILFNRTNTVDLVGKTAIYRGQRPAIFAGYLIRVNTLRDHLVPDYLNYVLNTNVSRRHSTKILSVAVGQANINGQKLKTYPIPLPPTLDEQRAIAAALSDADELLAALDRLIAKQRDLKQATMQELLTGKRRLPGFSGKWETKRLGDLGDWKGGMTPSMQEPSFWQGGTVPWISSGDVKSARLTNTGYLITEQAVKRGATTMLPAMSVVIVTRSGILRRYLPVAMNMIPMAINQDIKALLPASGILPEYMGHSINAHGDAILAACLKSGTTVESIEFAWLKAFTVPIPAMGEQTAIAAVLSDMDAEIAVLEARRDKARAVKQGMMQELLTGRIRLA